MLSAAGGRKDVDGPRSAQQLSFYSARGDPDPQEAISGETIDYSPTLTAPGTNVRSVLDPTATPNAAHHALQRPLGGHPAAGQGGARGVLHAAHRHEHGRARAHRRRGGDAVGGEGAARAASSRPAEVEGIVTRNADAMTPIDALYDFPCGTPGTDCGTAPAGLGLTGQPLEKWQNGAGYLDIPGAVAEVEAIPRPAGRRRSSEPGARSCADRVAPRAGLRYAGLRLRSRRRLTVSGRAVGQRLRRAALGARGGGAPRRHGAAASRTPPAASAGCGPAAPRAATWPTAGGSSWSLALGALAQARALPGVGSRRRRQGQRQPARAARWRYASASRTRRPAARGPRAWCPCGSRARCGRR